MSRTTTPIADSEWPRVLVHNLCLDKRGGAGLGLSIVQDMLAALLSGA